MTNKLQIGVVGTYLDKKMSKQLISVARDVGKEIAKSGHILVFGPELDGDSLSTQAALGARKEGGKTIGIVYGSKGKLFNSESADYIIRTGSERGGPRESVLVMSCDGLIAISGGSGTMTEMMIAYMNHRPVVVLQGSGGWSDKMANEYFDHRKRAKAIGVKTPVEAIEKITKAIQNPKLDD